MYQITLQDYEEISYSDHHIFSIDDLKDINKKFEKIQSPNKLILTTEKDAVRFLNLKKNLVKHAFICIAGKTCFFI